MTVCQVTEGDVVCVAVRGDNGEEKRRFSVVLERVPMYAPDIVVLMFGCSNTKRSALDARFFRIEPNTQAFRSMGLSNGTTFHIEDVRAFDAWSPQLKKVGRVPRAEFLKLKALGQQWLAEGHILLVLPEKHARPIASATAASLVERSRPPEPPK